MIWRQTMSQKSRRREAGQTVMVAALAMIPLLMMVGLVVDGGFALANQRRNQNAADAAANAGAVLLMENLPFGLTGQPVPRTDADVENAVVSTATTNGVDANTVVAYYTDIEGDRLDPEVEVGSLGTVPPPTDAYGVEAEGSMSFGTFFAGIAGFADLTTGARATAVTGTAPGDLLGDRGLRLHSSHLPDVLDQLRRKQQTGLGLRRALYDRHEPDRR